MTREAFFFSSLSFLSFYWLWQFFEERKWREEDERKSQGKCVSTSHQHITIWKEINMTHQGLHTCWKQMQLYSTVHSFPIISQSTADSPVNFSVGVARNCITFVFNLMWLMVIFTPWCVISSFGPVLKRVLSHFLLVNWSQIAGCVKSSEVKFIIHNQDKSRHFYQPQDTALLAVTWSE